MYIVIMVLENGEIVVHRSNKKDLETDLNTPGELSDDVCDYLEEIPNSDPMYWHRNTGKNPVLIIKGEVVTPNKKTVLSL